MSRLAQGLRKSNSTGSLFISTTINNPCVDSIINSVATILHSQILEDIELGHVIHQNPQDNELFIFSEDKYILENPDVYDPDRIE